MGNCCGKREVMVVKNERVILQRQGASIFREKITKFSDYKKKYEYLSLIGSGGFGKVRLFRDRNCKTLKYAIKTIKKNLLNSHSIQCIIDEVKILRSVDHPHIVKYFETYEEEHYIHIVMEYIPGENLFDLILRNREGYKQYNTINNLCNKDKDKEKDKENYKETDDKEENILNKEPEFKPTNHSSSTNLYMISKKKLVFTEHEICQIIISILKAILFLHRANIIHRDLKPENILFSNHEDLTSVKLIDFGLSVLERRVEKYRVGSPYYMAPEMIDGNYSKTSDMWSIGVILYLLLTGKHPFDGCDQTQVYKKIQRGLYDKKLLKENKWSPEIRDFVQKLLIVNESERMNSDEAFEHKWILKFATQNTPTAIINETIIESLKTFSKNNILQKEIFFYLAKISNEKELLELKKAFDELDENNTGVIEFFQLENLMKKLNIKATQEEIKEIWDGMDFHSDGKVNYTEFLAATLSSIKDLKEEKLLAAFKFFDYNDCGFITAKSLIDALKNNDIPIDEDGLYCFFENFYNINKKLNFQEFKQLFTSRATEGSTLKTF